MKKNVLIIFLTVLCFSHTLKAQVAPAIEWQKSLGGSLDDGAYSIQQTTDGGFIVAGYSSSVDGDVLGNHGHTDDWIVKLDEFGNLQWQKSFGGTWYDYANFIQQTTDGGFIVAGHSGSDDGDVSGNQGIHDYWILKLDLWGNLQWEKALGGSDWDEAQCIQQTTDGGFIVAGGSESDDGDVIGNHGYSDYWIIKFNSSGSIEWQKSLGGSDYDWAYSIRQTSDGGFIVAGWSASNDGDVSGNHGGGDDWIVKLNSSGDIQWQKSLGGTGEDGAVFIRQTTDGGFIAAGYAWSSDGDITGHHGSSANSDYWIVKLDSIGNLQWQRSLGTKNSDWAYSVEQTFDGGYVIAGYSKSQHVGSHGLYDYWIVKLDMYGNNQWHKYLGGSDDDEAFAIQQTTDGRFIVCGWSQSVDGDISGNHGSLDFWIVKLYSCSDSLIYYLDEDSDGYGNPEIKEIISACSVLAGYVIDSSDCDDSNAAINPSIMEVCNNLDDNCDGSIDEGFTLLTYYADNDSDNYGDSNNSVLACTLPNGYVTDQTDCDDTNPNVNPGMLEILNNGIDDNCNGDIDEFGVGFSTIAIEPFFFSIYPNPASQNIYVNYSLASPAIVKMELYDVLGNKLQELSNDFDAGEHRLVIDTRKFSNGVYYLRIQAGEQIISQEIVVVN